MVTVATRMQDDCPTFGAPETKETVLFQAALAAKWKEPPRDALDTMVLKTGLKLPQGGEEVQVIRHTLPPHTHIGAICAHTQAQGSSPQAAPGLRACRPPRPRDPRLPGSCQPGIGGVL